MNVYLDLGIDINLQTTTQIEMFRLLLSKRFFAKSLKEYQELFKQRKYKQVLGAQGDASISDIKAKFYVLIKKHHPDTKVQSKVKSDQNNKISSILITSYETIMKESKGGTANQTEYNKSSQPFGRQDNQSSKPSQNAYAAQNNENSPMRKYMGVFTMGIVGLVVLGGISIIIEFKNNRKKDRLIVAAPITTEKMTKIVDLDIKKKEDHLQFLVDGYVKELPPTLKYPSYGDLDIITQLKKYSIMYDISLYEVDPSFFMKEEYSLPDFTQSLERYKKPITYIKVNTIMTLSLQAQRCLHNTYVSKKDLIRELKTKGFYEPPAIMFRFYGYVYFKIRTKPLNLNNYKGEEWISLFDLYFQYYSPIFIRKNRCNEYSALTMAGHAKDADKSQDQFIGSVHLNHRPIESVYLKKDQKVAMFYKFTDQKRNSDTRYSGIWSGFYSQRANAVNYSRDG